VKRLPPVVITFLACVNRPQSPCNESKGQKYFEHRDLGVVTAAKQREVTQVHIEIKF
jgi:hypothetical protein